MQRENKPSTEIKPIDIPYIHSKIKLSDLKPPHLGLLDEAELKSFINKNKITDGTYGIVGHINDNSQNTLEIIKAGKNYYAVYGLTEKDRHLGAGGFGVVCLMQNLKDGTWHAIKYQKKWTAENKEKEAKEQAFQVMLVDRENVALRTLNEFDFAFANDDAHISGMSLGSGIEMFNGVLQPQRKFNTVRWFDMAVSSLLDLKRIHDAGLFHLDIKPENMLFDSASHKIKLIDYGMAEFYDKKSKTLKGNWRGAERFMAPEILKVYKLSKQRKQQRKDNGMPESKDDEMCEFSEATEVYSMGVALKEMFGAPQYTNIEDPEMRKAVKKYLKQMTAHDPHARPSLVDAIKTFEIIRDEQLRTPDLLNRVACVDIVEHKDFLANIALLADDDYKRKKDEIDRLKLHLHYKIEKLEKIMKDPDSTSTSLDKINGEIKKLEEDIRRNQAAIAAREAKIKEIAGIDSLKAANEVWLVLPDNAAINSLELIKAKRALENLGIIVNSHANKAADVKAYAEQREDKDKGIYICANFHKDEPLKYPDQISERHYQIIMRTLDNDMQRIAGKDPNDTRAQAIKATIEEFKAKKTSEAGIKYTDVDEILEKLQSKVYSTKAAMAYLERNKRIQKYFHFHHSTARKHIAHMRDDAKIIEAKLKSK